MINENNNVSADNDSVKPESSNTIANNNIDNQILNYNKAGVNSLYLCFVPFVIFLIGYIHSGGSFDEGGSGAVWWLYFPLIFVVSPITILISICLGVIGLEGNKKIFSYISLFINAIELLFVFAILH